MTFLKDDLYRDNISKLSEYFQNNFKTEEEESHPSLYKYDTKQIPNSFFTAVDVYSKTGQFLRRYLIVAVIDGNSKVNTPETYSNHIELLCDLPNPTGSSYSQGIAVLLVDNKIEFLELLLQRELRQVNCGT